jgi:hypothetical protein
MKLTPWFSGKQKPVRVGLYQRDIRGIVVYAWWNGHVWSLGDKSKRRVLSFKRHSSYHQDLDWRGVMK